MLVQAVSNWLSFHSYASIYPLGCFITDVCITYLLCFDSRVSKFWSSWQIHVNGKVGSEPLLFEAVDVQHTDRQIDSQTRERTPFTLVLRSMTKGYRRSTTSIGARSPIVAAQLISTPLTSLDHGTDLVAAPLVVLLLQRHTAAIAKISSVITICAMITTTTAATRTDVDCDSPSDKTPMMPLRT